MTKTVRHDGIIINICPHCGHPMQDPETADLGKKYFVGEGGTR